MLAISTALAGLAAALAVPPGLGVPLRLSALQAAPIPTANESTNWAGYVASGAAAQFSGVSATWQVPAVSPSPRGSSSTWVGIDGTATPDLVQVGTTQDQTAGGPVYNAWYEFLPGNAVRFGAVRPGDIVTAGVQRLSTDRWLVRLQDITSGRSWVHAATYQAEGTSAEWVEELPTVATTGQEGTLAHFAPVRFTKLTVSGTNVDATVARPIYMVSKAPARVLAHPLAYDSTAGSFSVAYGPPDPWPTSFPAVPIGHPTTPPSTTPSTTTVPTSSTTSLPPTSVPSTGGTGPARPGLWLAHADGTVSAYGAAPRFPPAPVTGSHPLVGIAPAGHRAYWAVSSDGGVFTYGGAHFYGSLPSLGIHAAQLAAPVVGIASTQDGRGYLVASRDGGVFAFGDARFAGSCETGARCPAPVVGIASDPANHGYWLVLGDCTVVAFGGAPPSTAPACHKRAQAHHVVVVAAAARPSGLGVWMMLSDASLFPSGPRPKSSWYEHTGGTATTSFVPKALAVTSDGGGAWVASAQGGLRRYGDAPALPAVPGGPAAQTGSDLHRVVGAAGW